MLKYSASAEGPQWLSDEQIEQLPAAAVRVRDRFLVSLLACTGMRIGEALGLHRQDMHLLSNSEMLGCQVAGPHVHVRRRLNANGALAKSRFSRWILVTEDLVDGYAEYLHERAAQLPAEMDGDGVFVNLYAGRRGQPVTYVAARDMFDRLARRVGFEARPHMLRHSAATRWIRAGIDRDVVQLPYGNCTEPTTIKAGGKSCPLRFQCVGCGFYRPDPSYLPAVEGTHPPAAHRPRDRRRTRHS
ncbi:tyrosine-type recombinase/integrase [Streptomyces sp. JJ38]|uniref:tyrosine-type recombinase/integrase n=1 Tax=Streptomyces sp. JJ38 TaxID=2738128 RepID=UPI00214C66F5|nr:tyrosine-type recombinase/integrase [Streptomyces sp. JJ38]